MRVKPFVAVISGVGADPVELMDRRLDSEGATPHAVALTLLSSLWECFNHWSGTRRF